MKAISYCSKIFGEREIYIREKLRDSDHLKSIITAKFIESIRYFNGEVNNLIFSEAQPAIILYRSEMDSNYKNLDIMMEEVAQQIKGKKSPLLVVVSDLKTNLEVSVGIMVGVTITETPAVRILDTREGFVKYKTDNITKKGILEFIDEWENGKLATYNKSQTKPEFQDDVYKVVGATWKEVVYDKTKDVLVMFCNTDNDKCLEIQSIYETFAKRMKVHNSGTLLVAQINNKVNDIPDFNIHKVPQIKLFPAGNKTEHYTYTKEHYNFKDILAFVKKNAKNKIYVTKEDL